jgi:hypothetical protein
MSSMDADPRDARSGGPQTAVRNGPRVSFWIRELPFSLALQLPFLTISESMGNHDSKIVDADSVD